MRKNQENISLALYGFVISTTAGSFQPPQAFFSDNMMVEGATYGPIKFFSQRWRSILQLAI